MIKELEGQLNEAQYAAVTCDEGPVLVLAGAGSGKTRVLAYRIAYLLERGTDPGSILAITFTNKAAAEMRERVQLLTGSLVDAMWVSTFHSACLRILRRHADRLGYDGGFAVFDDVDSRALVRACLDSLGLDERRLPPARVAAAIDRAKNELKGPEEFAAEAAGPYERRLAAVYALYQERLRENNVMDFGDLLLNCVRLLREHQEVRDYYVAKFRHILVDEYQDTNRAQYELVRLLAGRRGNVFCVGDADQSIYGFRGADIRNILDFERDYPQARVIKLEENYRSTQYILDAAAHVIANNRHRRPRRLVASRGPGEKVVVHEAADEAQEAGFVAAEIEKGLLQEGRRLRDFAVFYRTHAQSRSLEEVLMRRQIPYVIVGGLRFYERREVKDVLAYLRVIANPYDAISLRRAASYPRRGLGEVTLARVEEYARARALSLLDALQGAASIPGLAAHLAQRAREFGELLAELARRALELPPSRLIGEVLEASGYAAALRAEDTLEASSRLENLGELVSVASELERRRDVRDLEGFLAELALMTDVDRHDPAAEAVSLMTLHSAKGLEFPVVFLVGMEEGLLPHQRSREDDAQLEEERRLCYVGMTRAKDRLYLTWARRRMVFGSTTFTTPSRFLDEIPAELKDEAGPAAEDLAVGDRVEHPRFGVGTIVSSRGEGEDREVDIAFPDLGIKRFILGYANLRKV